MITPIGTLFNRMPATILSVEADDRSAGNTTSDGYLALNKLTGGQSDGYWLPPLAGHVASEFSKVHDRPVPNEIEEPAGSSILDDPLTYRLYLMACAVVGVLIGGGGYIYYRLKAKKGELQKNASTPLAEPKMYRVNGLKTSTATVERETWKPEVVIANLMMKEDRELGAKKEGLERAVTAAITEWFDLPVEQREALLKTAPDAVTFSKDGTREETILYPWAKERALKIHAESPTSPPPRGAQIESETDATRRALDGISEVLSFLRTSFVTVADIKDTALATNHASWAMEALTKGDAQQASPEFVREKAGVLHVLGEMFESLGAFEEMRTAYDLLVKYQVLNLVVSQRTWYQLETFRNRDGSMTSKLLIFGNAVRAFDVLRTNNIWQDNFRSFVDSIVRDEPQLSPLRELVSGTITTDDIDKIATGAIAKALESFQDNWEKTTPTSAKLKEWHERLGRIGTHIRKAREARRGKRK